MVHFGLNFKHICKKKKKKKKDREEMESRTVGKRLRECKNKANKIINQMLFLKRKLFSYLECFFNFSEILHVLKINMKKFKRFLYGVLERDVEREIHKCWWMATKKMFSCPQCMIQDKQRKKKVFLAKCKEISVLKCSVTCSSYLNGF